MRTRSRVGRATHDEPATPSRADTKRNNGKPARHRTRRATTEARRGCGRVSETTLEDGWHSGENWVLTGGPPGVVPLDGGVACAGESGKQGRVGSGEGRGFEDPCRGGFVPR
jgi:hypothetical protein